MARDGVVFDRGSWITSGHLWIFSLILAAVLSAVICLIQRGLMKKKVRQQTDAMDYLKGGAVNITLRRDVFSHATEVRQKIETDSGSSGSSGGYSHSSDGFSGKSGIINGRVVSVGQIVNDRNNGAVIF